MIYKRPNSFKFSNYEIPKINLRRIFCVCGSLALLIEGGSLNIRKYYSMLIMLKPNLMHTFLLFLSSIYY